jgi:hypothetical protein
MATRDLQELNYSDQIGLRREMLWEGGGDISSQQHSAAAAQG